MQKLEKCDNAPHKYFNFCGRSRECVKTCEYPLGYGDCPDSYECVPGCYCGEGYLEDANGVCVLPEECPAIQRKKSFKKLLRKLNKMFNLNQRFVDSKSIKFIRTAVHIQVVKEHVKPLMVLKFVLTSVHLDAFVKKVMFKTNMEIASYLMIAQHVRLSLKFSK
jgi:hypothetical protein